MLKGKTRRSMALQADPGAFPAPPFPLRNGLKRVERGSQKAVGAQLGGFLTAKVLEDVGGHPGPELTSVNCRFLALVAAFGLHLLITTRNDWREPELVPRHVAFTIPGIAPYG